MRKTNVAKRDDQKRTKSVPASLALQRLAAASMQADQLMSVNKQRGSEPESPQGSLELFWFGFSSGSAAQRCFGISGGAAPPPPETRASSLRMLMFIDGARLVLEH